MASGTTRTSGVQRGRYRSSFEWSSRTGGQVRQHRHLPVPLARLDRLPAEAGPPPQPRRRHPRTHEHVHRRCRSRRRRFAGPRASPSSWTVACWSPTRQQSDPPIRGRWPFVSSFGSLARPDRSITPWCCRRFAAPCLRADTPTAVGQLDEHDHFVRDWLGPDPPFYNPDVAVERDDPSTCSTWAGPVVKLSPDGEVTTFGSFGTGASAQRSNRIASAGTGLRCARRTGGSRCGM